MLSILESFRAAMSAIRAHLLRSMLTTLGIVIAVAAVIAVVSVIQGLGSFIGAQFQGLGADSVIIYPHLTRAERLAGRTGRVTESDLLAIQHDVAGIKNITPVLNVAQFGGQICWHGTCSTTTIRGTTSSYAEGPTYPVSGRFITPMDNLQHRRICVVGHTVVKNLDLPKDPLGRYIQVSGQWFRIVGVLKRRGNFFGHDLDNEALIPYTTARSILGTERKPSLIIQLNVANTSTLASTVSRIKQVIHRNHYLHDLPTDDFRVQTSKQITQQLDKITGTVTLILGGIVGISLLVGGIGIMNIMLVSVTERTREIGILKSLGARRQDILAQFLIEAFLLSLIGGLIGLALGWTLGIVSTSVIPGLKAAYVPGWAIALAFGFSGGTGIVFGIIPAAKAASLDPIDALRYE